MPIPINSNIDYDRLINQLDNISLNKLKTNMQTIPMADPRDSFNYEQFEKEMLNNTNSFFNKRQPTSSKTIHKPTHPKDVLARKLERENKRQLTKSNLGL